VTPASTNEFRTEGSAITLERPNGGIVSVTRRAEKPSASTHRVQARRSVLGAEEMVVFAQQISDLIDTDIDE
jgi:hypothetical protein